MIELLCVMAIIGIMASLLLPAVSRAYHWAKGMTEELEASDVMYLLVKETRHYCTANSQYTFASKSEFADKCNLALECRRWVEAVSTDFVAFNYFFSQQCGGAGVPRRTKPSAHVLFHQDRPVRAGAQLIRPSL
jgi:type II secretory pathway pseudopilin PulG